MKIARKLVLAMVLVGFAFAMPETGYAARSSTDCHYSFGNNWQPDGGDVSDLIDDCCGEDFPDAFGTFTDCNIIIGGQPFCAGVDISCLPIICCD